MEIGVVVHGPNIIDSGYAIYILNILSNYGKVHCRLGGTMGRTAVIDASLENVIDISEKLFPSQSLKKFKNEDMDCIFLLNYGKSSTTGQVFGYKVFNNYCKGLLDNDTPVIQIERPGEDDGSVILWDGDDTTLQLSKDSRVELESLPVNKFVNNIANELELNIVNPEDIRLKYFKEDFMDGGNKRYVYGVSPNENILVNGMVVGKSTSENIILVSDNGIITDIVGGIIKPHGVEKLGKVNLQNAIIKTGLLRKTDKIKPRIIENKKDTKYIEIAYLNHAAEDVYKYKNADLVISIGDDTTLLTSDILYRFNIPIIGITDGDLDKVVEKGFTNKKSKIIQLEPGYDDIIGEKIFNNIFNQEKILKIKTPENKTKEQHQEETINRLTNEILQIVNNINCNFNILNKV